MKQRTVQTTINVSLLLEAFHSDGSPSCCDINYIYIDEEASDPLESRNSTNKVAVEIYDIVSQKIQDQRLIILVRCTA